VNVNTCAKGSNEFLCSCGGDDDNDFKPFVPS